MSFGRNDDGELGLGDNIDKNVPTLIPNLNNVTSISLGEFHSLVLLSK